MINQFIFKLTLVSLFYISFTISAHIKNDWTLRIYHTNDMHSRFDEVSGESADCSEEQRKSGKCYGGFARLATMIREGRKDPRLPTIFLNAGDTFQGTAWFTIYKSKIVSKFLNFLEPDAAALGNHEFDDGPAALVPFLRNITFPIVAANLDLSGEPELAATNVTKSVILNVDGRKIGVIGYLTPDTKQVSKTGQIIFHDEIASIKEEVNKLKAQGINILIALGHSGIEVDKKIAFEVEDLDLVIGGHTHTFLYSGKGPTTDTAEDEYPVKIVQKSGRKVYVVQAGSFTKYLGTLMVVFDNKGEIKKITGNPIFLDNSIEQASDVLAEIEKLRPDVKKLGEESVGISKVVLYHSNECRTKECNLGNLIADAMVHANAELYEDDNGWTDAAVAMIGSGTIKTSIKKSYPEHITMADIRYSLPHENKIVKTKVTSEKLLEMLEFNVAHLEHNVNYTDPEGCFMQLSGLQVTYDLSQPKGSKVVRDKLLIRCADCDIPVYETLKNDKIYKILISDFIQSGGDGYDMMIDTESTPIGIAVDRALVNYMKRSGLIYTPVEGRIKFSTDIKNTKTISLGDLNFNVDLEIDANF